MRLFCIALILFVNCALAQDSVRLSGRILNQTSDSIQVSYNDNRIAYYPRDFYSLLDKKGNFTLAFPVPAGGFTQVQIIHGIHVAETLMQPGDSLVMTADEKHFDSTIHFKGKGSAIENFIARHTLEKGRMNQYTIRLKTAMNKEPADFLSAIADEKKTELDFLYSHRTGLSPRFITYYTAFYEYYNYFFIQQYPQMHQMIKLRRYTDTVPEENYVVVKHMPDAFNDSLLGVPSYLLYLTGVFDTRLRANGYTLHGNDTMKLRILQDTVIKLVYKLLPENSAEYFMAQNLYGRARNERIEKTEDLYASFKKHWPQSEYLPILEKQVAIAERLAPGQPAPDFDITGPDGRTSRLSDLRGKVVYLQFWASWCKQCVGEMLKENKMKLLIKNKPVEFVYVSIDEDSTADKEIIDRFKLSGIFAHPGGGWGAKEVESYGVQSLPAFFLIDDRGKFAIQNPPTPLQSTELILAIEKLIK